MKKVDTLKQARQVLSMPDLKDKVICFISDWEKTKVTPYMPTEDDEKEYIFQELRLFETAKNWLQKDGDFSFVAFREFEDDDEIDYEEIEKVKKEYPVAPPTEKDFLSELNYESILSRFMTKKSLAYFRLREKERDLVGHDISILPTSTDYDYIKYLKEADKLVEWHKLNILCIDYKHFPYLVINHFLKHILAWFNKENLVVSEELKPLYNLFRSVSPDIVATTQYWLKIYIDRAFEGSLKVKDWDQIEFLSINHLQNTTVPYFWKDISKTGGYLCKGNVQNIKKGQSDKQEDVRVFYSFESLLFYELRSCLKRIKRCANCGSIMGIDKQKYKGKYCPPNSKNYASCSAERNRKRQTKHYNLTNI